MTKQKKHSSEWWQALLLSNRDEFYRQKEELSPQDSVNLSGAWLSGATLSNVNLSGVNLTGAYLVGADLSGANLRGTNLTMTDLGGANLCGAELRGANFFGALGLDRTQKKLIIAELRKSWV